MDGSFCADEYVSCEINETNVVNVLYVATGDNSGCQSSCNSDPECK